MPWDAPHYRGRRKGPMSSLASRLLTELNIPHLLVYDTDRGRPGAGLNRSIAADTAGVQEIGWTLTLKAPPTFGTSRQGHPRLRAFRALVTRGDPAGLPPDSRDGCPPCPAQNRSKSSRRPRAGSSGVAAQPGTTRCRREPACRAGRCAVSAAPLTRTSRSPRCRKSSA